MCNCPEAGGVPQAATPPHSPHCCTCSEHYATAIHSVPRHSKNRISFLLEKQRHRQNVLLCFYYCTVLQMFVQRLTKMYIILFQISYKKKRRKIKENGKESKFSFLKKMCEPGLLFRVRVWSRSNGLIHNHGCQSCGGQRSGGSGTGVLSPYVQHEDGGDKQQTHYKYWHRPTGERERDREFLFICIHLF